MLGAVRALTHATVWRPCGFSQLAAHPCPAANVWAWRYSRSNDSCSSSRNEAAVSADG